MDAKLWFEYLKSNSPAIFGGPGSGRHKESYEAYLTSENAERHDLKAIAEPNVGTLLRAKDANHEASRLHYIAANAINDDDAKKQDHLDSANKHYEKAKIYESQIAARLSELYKDENK